MHALTERLHRLGRRLLVRDASDCGNYASGRSVRRRVGLLGDNGSDGRSLLLLRILTIRLGLLLLLLLLLSCWRETEKRQIEGKGRRVRAGRGTCLARCSSIQRPL